jgi:hypothetical protein
MYSIDVNADNAVVSIVVAVLADTVDVPVVIGTTRVPQEAVVPSVVKYFPELSV